MSLFPLQERTTPNGLHLVLMPRHEMQTVTVLVLIGVGSRYETARQGGLSHFLEHMFFKGTKTRPDKKEIAIALDQVGAEFNAFTGEEVTGYYVKVAKEHLALGADVVSDILLRSLFPATEIDRERGVIIEEIRMYTDSPMGHVQHLWQEALFGKHPLGRRIDGSVETVSSFKRADFVSYTREHYHAGNAVVVVAGNFEPKATQKLLTKLFADLPKGNETHPRPVTSKVPHRRFIHERRPSLDQTHLIVGTHGVSLTDQRRWAADILATILGGGMSSRLFMAVREEHGLAYAVRSHSDSYTDAGNFATQAGLRTDQAAFALKLILQEYDRIMVELVEPGELEKAKQMIRGHMVLQLEETNALATYAAGQVLLEKKIETPDEALRHIEEVTADDIRNVARQLLQPRRRAVALLGPQRSTKEFERLLTK